MRYTTNRQDWINFALFQGDKKTYQELSERHMGGLGINNLNFSKTNRI